MAWPTLMGRRRRAARGWSEFGEDARLADELRDHLADGYYVDVGANHPAIGSNTFRLYNLGMRGVCVEPNPELCALHQRYRPGDMVVSAAIGGENGLAKYYELSYHGVSTFSQADAERRQAAGAKLLRVSVRPVLRLATILEHCVPEGRRSFEFLSVDTEGWDEIVLRSNDWSRFRPRFALVECNSQETGDAVAALLRDANYEKVDSFGVNNLFRRTEG
jgi:FkbM family methyltransferase